MTRRRFAQKDDTGDASGGEKQVLQCIEAAQSYIHASAGKAELRRQIEMRQPTHVMLAAFG